jgi:hypothetical protein
MAQDARRPPCVAQGRWRPFGLQDWVTIAPAILGAALQSPVSLPEVKGVKLMLHCTKA